jgi:hypothetical protein
MTIINHAGSEGPHPIVWREERSPNKSGQKLGRIQLLPIHARTAVEVVLWKVTPGEERRRDAPSLGIGSRTALEGGRGPGSEWTPG